MLTERLSLITRGGKKNRSSDRIGYVFRDLTLDMQLKSCLAIMGPNGCGKSTLLRSFLGLIALDEGRVDLVMRQGDLLGTVLQDYRSQLLPWASVKTNLLLPFGGNCPISTSVSAFIHSAEEFLVQLGYDFSLSQPTRHLSGGQQQAVVLARALASCPEILIWDEPTSAIDMSRRQILYHYLLNYQHEVSPTLIIVTHDFDEALILADRLLIFDEEMRVVRDEPVVREEGIASVQLGNQTTGRSARPNSLAAMQRVAHSS